MGLTKAELATSLIDKFGLNKIDAKNLVDNFFEELCIALEKGQQIKISGFGNLELKDKKARPGRNPKTGEGYIISPRRVVVFKQGQKLKSIVSGVTIVESEQVELEQELEKESV